jgi:hypothetical protein
MTEKVSQRSHSQEVSAPTVKKEMVFVLILKFRISDASRSSTLVLVGVHP